MKPYRLEITLTGLPKRINQFHGSSWQVKYAESRKWQLRLYAKMLITKQHSPPEPLNKANVTLIRHSSRCPDYDGLVSSFKRVIDALKKLNVIKDDNMNVIGKPEYQWVQSNPKHGFITVIVEEVRNEDKP